MKGFVVKILKLLNLTNPIRHIGSLVSAFNVLPRLISLACPSPFWL